MGEGFSVDRKVLPLFVFMNGVYSLVNRKS